MHTPYLLSSQIVPSSTLYLLVVIFPDVLCNGLGQINRQNAARFSIQMALIFLQLDTPSAVHVQATQVVGTQIIANIKLGGVGVGLPAGLDQLLLLPVGRSLGIG
jgi:energy-converting hydrogenase Eha subunit A